MLELPAGRIELRHVEAHVEDIFDNDRSLRGNHTDLLQLPLKIRQDLALVPAHLKVFEIIIGISGKSVPLEFRGNPDTVFQPFLQAVDLLPDPSLFDPQFNIVRDTRQRGLHFALDDKNLRVELILHGIRVPEQVEDQGEPHTGEHDKELVDNDRRCKFRH